MRPLGKFYASLSSRSRKALLAASTLALACLVTGCIINPDNSGSGNASNTSSLTSAPAPAPATSAPAPASSSTPATSSASTSSAVAPDPNGVNRFLNDWHHAASVADEDAYFGSMTPDGIFVGTDKTEHWTRQEFIDAFQDKHFVDKEEAWTYYPQSRNVHFSPDATVAWFDEKLLAKDGFHVRGSGVVLRQPDGTWKIAHYVMSFPVPNEVAKQVLDIIDEHENKVPTPEGSTTGG